MMQQKLKQWAEAKKTLNQKREMEKAKKLADVVQKKKQKEEYKKGVEEYFQKKKA